MLTPRGARHDRHDETLPTRTAAPCDLQAIDEAAKDLLDVLTLAGLDDPRWETAGPLVSEAALRLRQAVSAPTTGCTDGAPPIVCERDLATAARCLLARHASVQDAGAAEAFVHVAAQAALALS